MKSCILNIFAVFLYCASLSAQSTTPLDLSYYLPQGTTYDANIPTPKDILGHEIGDWHLTHDKLVYYLRKLAEKSSRVKVETIGYTYEHRPLLNVIITSVENQNKLSEIHEQHLKYADPSSPDTDVPDNMPVVVRLGYSIHGNEASGSNAAVLVAYYLAASQSVEVQNMLQNSVVLIDPCLNPDGMQRFSTWVNEHKSAVLNADPNGREFHESWPDGRTNHYWFDLNRDWLLVQHPESVARVQVYHNWLPNVQTDHHEMRSNATFFFQPGVPSRNHPLIPQRDVVLTKKIAKYHVQAFDSCKRLYYSEESYDDFYIGKGSTYPDLQGGIGILFEQASARGHLQETDNGLLSFPFAIKNHVISSLSTLRAALVLKDELLRYQHDFFATALKESSNNQYGWIVLGTPHDPARIKMLAQALQIHDIRRHALRKNITLDGIGYDTATSMAVPLQQRQYKLIRAMFERRTEFQDSLFYDVSAWDFDLAYGANMSWVGVKHKTDFIGEEMDVVAWPDAGREKVDKNAYAWIIDWRQYFAPALVYTLQKNDIKIKVASRPFKSPEGRQFPRGTMVIPAGIQTASQDNVHELLVKYAEKYHVHVQGTSTGYLEGIDIGSNSFRIVKKPIVAMLVGKGVSSYAAGEIWHLLDQRFGMPVTMIDILDVDRVQLGRYTVMVMPDGTYGQLGASAQSRITDWVKSGGILVATQNAIKKVLDMNLAAVKIKKKEQDTLTYVPYADRDKLKGGQVIGGAIFNLNIDPTHPLAYGYDHNTLAVFKRGTLALQQVAQNIKTPFAYAAHPLLSGYASSDNINAFCNSPAVFIDNFGMGKVIGLLDDYNFRAYWIGTNKVFMNSLFFGNQINTR